MTKNFEVKDGVCAEHVDGVPKSERKLSLLVVDDEQAIREALSRWFELRGFLVQTASDGAAAAELCAQHHYDAVTMDLEMPRLGGAEAIAAVRAALGRDVPILILTGYPRNADMALSAGAAKVLVKPIRLRELEHEIMSLLEQSPPAVGE